MNLTAEQQGAAGSTELVTVTIAGPGTGKTRALVARVAELLDRGVPADRIAVVTFTTAAAREVEGRMPEGARRVWCGTLHALAGSVLRAYPEPVNRTATFSVYDQIDADAIALEVAAGFGVEGGPGVVLQNARVRAAFDERLRASNALVYDQLIPLARELLVSQAGNHRLVQHRYQEILVDESQDLDEDQYALLHDLAPASVWLVGDPRQSIFVWRGARPDLLTDRPGVRHALTLNYRSTRAVVDAVNRVGEPWPPPVVAHRVDPGLVREHAADYEFTTLPELLQDLEARGYPLDHVAILGRSWRALGQANRYLREKKIRTRFYGDSTDPWNIEPGRTLLRWLALNLNLTDDNLAGLVARGIYGPTLDLGPLRARAMLERRTLRHILIAAHLLPAMLPKTEPTIEHAKTLRAHMLRARPDAWTVKGDWCVDGLEAPGRRTLSSFRFWMAFARAAADRMASVGPDRPPGVHMMTVHAAKGLEFPVVIIIGACEKNLGRSEEDRHVLYVACSRARDELHLVRSTREPYHESLGVTV